MTTYVDSKAQPIHPFDALATIGCIYLGLVTAGFAAFRYLAVLPAGASRNQDQAFFASVNAVTLTGFRQGNASVQNFPALGLDLVALLSAASALSSLIGGGYLLARVVRLRISLMTLTLFSAAILLVPAACLSWSSPFDALSASVGLGWATRPPGPLAGVLFVGASVFGLLGPLPLREFALGRRASGDDSRGYVALTFAVVAALTIVGVALLAAAGTPIVFAGSQSLALRSFGGTRVDVAAGPALPWIVAALSILGAAPASTAGGLGVLPVIVLIHAAIDSLRSRAIDSLAGVAIVWLFAFAMLSAAAVIGLATLAPSLPADRVILLTFAALGNVGVSHDPIGLTGASLFLLSAAMLVGRLLSLVMLAWMACVAERNARMIAP